MLTIYVLCDIIDTGHNAHRLKQVCKPEIKHQNRSYQNNFAIACERYAL